MSAFNHDHAAAVLIEALVSNDEAVCLKYGISLRTVQRWRRRLATDPGLSSAVATKKAALDAAWADDLAAPIRAAARLITDAAEGADVITKRNPEFVHAIAGALKICAEIKLIVRVLDARLQGGTQKGEDEQSGLASAGYVS